MSATLSGLTIGSLELTPAFDGAVTEYTATTTNATNTVTATPADNKAEVTILNGDTAVENGKAATWQAGVNTLTVKVTNGSESKIYTVTVTKE